MEYTTYELLWFFLAYAFLGWLAETALAAAKRGRLINRGFLNMPFSPVYGLALARYTERNTSDAPSQSALGELLDTRFPDERMERIYPKAVLVED